MTLALISQCRSTGDIDKIFLVLVDRLKDYSYFYPKVSHCYVMVFVSEISHIASGHRCKLQLNISFLYIHGEIKFKLTHKVLSLCE